VALCLPTSAVSREILELLLPSLLEKPCVILDHTSGNPLETQALADYVRELSGGRVTCTWAAAESACFALLRSVWLVWLLWLLSVLCVLCLLLLFIIILLILRTFWWLADRGGSSCSLPYISFIIVRCCCC
jgi:hypothetical protein